MILKICMDHPHHGIVQLLTLANGSNVGNDRTTGDFLANFAEGKSIAARSLIDQLKHSGSELAALISSTETLCDSYVTLAMAKTDKWHGSSKPKDIGLAQVIGKGKVSLDRCLGRGNWGQGGGIALPAVLTKPPKVQKDCDYRMLIGSDLIVGFESTFRITQTGLHRPKIVNCIGETGRRYKQLVKGEDDIRQDSVIQLVFSTVNRLLGGSGALKITTYSVVPLSPTSGVLEWVLNTEPFGDFLVDSRSGGSSGISAHSKYFPGAWGNNLCRSHLRFAPVNGKLAAFQEICKRFPPAFRFFFQERFGHSVSAWFAARQNYTRSCAASSMVGHILGIGDRHTHNILISNKTGGVVHIDFGIVFEQGKVLTTPETIPFRLTRDIVDGMGVCGVEGLFSKSCSDVLRVLRENNSTLLTVLDVITNDPLYKFLVSPVQKRKAQARDGADDDEEGDGIHRQDEGEGMDGQGTAEEEEEEEEEDSNDAASRALTKIGNKLRGFEENTPEQLSIEGQVQLLINEARSEDNLSRLYFGWAPWL